MSTTVTIGRPPIYRHTDGREEELTIHKAYIESDAKRKIFVAHRRGRKTSLSLEEMFKYLSVNSGIIGKTLAPIRKQAKEIIWDDPDMLNTILPKELVKDANISELKVTLKNGSIWYLDGADQPDFQRGGNVKILHLTECGDHREEVWSSIYEPVLTLNGGIALFEGNPRGQNWYHRLWQRAGEREGWARFMATVNDTPIFTKEQLEDIRQSVPENVWLAEYMCEWVGSTGTVFRSIRTISTLEPKEAEPGHKYRFGIDLAKLQDYTYLSGVDRHSWNQVCTERFNQLDWVEQKTRIKNTLMAYSKRNNENEVEVLIESNGVGDPIYDDLWRWSAEVSKTHSIIVIPFRTTNASKALLVSNMSMLSDQGFIKLINNPIQTQEFEAFTYHKTAIAYIYGAPDGFHDDTVMGTMLSYWDLQGKFPLGRIVHDDEPKAVMGGNVSSTINRILKNSASSEAHLQKALH